MGAAEAFSPLKATLATISAVYAQYQVRPSPSFGNSFRPIYIQDTAAVMDKVESLRSRVAALEKVFEKPTDDDAEKKRRKELQTCVDGTDLHSTRTLTASQKIQVH